MPSNPSAASRNHRSTYIRAILLGANPRRGRHDSMTWLALVANSRNFRGALMLLRFPDSSGDSKPATTKSAISGTESKGRQTDAPSKPLRPFRELGPQSWQPPSLNSSAASAWADLLALGVCLGIAPDTKRSGRAVAKSHRKQPTLNGYNWTMSAVQYDNVRKVKCHAL